MTDWTAGYTAEIGYTFGYDPEFNPLRTRLAFLNAGLLPPEQGTHCELGFGQGISVNIHAAAAASTWYGTDFNPAQVGFAQALARASGAAAQLFDQSFADFCSRGDLPDFDSIGLHGIWSWVSDDNRAVITDFVKRKLKVGGVLYVSYNTQPGWAAMMPMRDLLTQHSQGMSAPGAGIIARVDGALDFAERLLATNPAYAQANPQIQVRIQGLKAENRTYVAHEYFNGHWLPMSFARMGEWLAPAKLDYACSAQYLDHIDGINLSAQQQALLVTLPDAVFRQTVRDFMVNQQFRKDYWVRGARRLDKLEQSEALRAQKVLLTTHRAGIALKVKGVQGEAALQAAIYEPILDALADHRPKTLHQLEQALRGSNIGLAQLTQAVVLLAGMGHLQPVQDDAILTKAQKATERLNAHLSHKARSSSDITWLGSPVTGGGVAVGRFPQLFLQAIAQGRKQPADWAQNVLDILKAQDQKILKDGKALETDADNLAELTCQAQEFAQKQLPILKALQIA